ERDPQPAGQEPPEGEQIDVMGDHSGTVGEQRYALAQDVAPEAGYLAERVEAVAVRGRDLDADELLVRVGAGSSDEADLTSLSAIPGQDSLLDPALAEELDLAADPAVRRVVVVEEHRHAHRGQPSS